MKSQLFTTALVVFISAKSFGIAVNDSCQNAVLLTVENPGASFTPLQQDLGTANNTPVDICGITQYYDLWYYFVATNDTQVVFLKSLSVGLIPSMELMSGNCSSLTSISCFTNNVNTLTGLTPGQTYYLRAYQQFAGYKYEISLLNVPSNDVCNAAYNLTIYRSDQPYIAGLYFWTAASNAGTNLCNPFNDYDVWFKFTAADTAQVLYIDGIAPYFEYEIFSGNCGSLVQKQCGGFTNTDHVKFQNLVIGEQYYFRMLSAVNNNAPLFKVALLNPVVNDHCQGAITIPMSASFSDDTEVSGDLWFGFPSNGTCTGENDLWYKFTASANSAFIKVQNFSAMSFSVYSGNCTSLTNVQCSIPVNGKVTGLSSGTTYYIQLHTADTKQNHFSIAVPPVLGNDDCDGAITVTPGDKLYPEFITEATTFSATQSLPGCAGNADDDVWFKFTANRTNYILDVTPEDINLYNAGFVYELFSGNCGSLTSIKCDTVKTDKLDPIKNLTIGQTYYLRIYTASATQFSHFKLAIYKSNDECIDAENLILTNNPSDVNERIYNSLSATQSLPGCQQNADDDIWFSFTASQTSHSYVISDYYGSFNPIVELFSGTCGSLTSLACISGTQGNFPDLTPGQQYYFRVYYSLAGWLSHFRIRVFTSPTNDEITGARQLPVTNEEVLGLTNQFTAGALPSFPNYCADSTVTVIEDVWYYFVAPQTAQYLINTSDINQSEFNVEAYSAPNNLQSNLISCGGITRIVPEAGTLTAGDTVLFRVYPSSSGGSYKGDFDLMVYVYPSAIINDEPADALDLNFTNRYQYTYNSNNFSLSSVTNSCLLTNGSNKDVWFKFNAPSLKTSIVVDDPPDVKSFIEIFSGSPGNLTSIECSDNILNLPASLVPGQQYYARILNSGGSYDIRIGIFYNDTLEKNNLVGLKCLGPNLVPNPSAECYTCNDVCKAEFIITGYELAGYYNTDDWFMATDGSADYFNSCAGGGQSANAPTSYIGSFGTYYVWNAIVPRNGKGYLGVFTYVLGNYREYIETELTQELIPGNSYLVSFYVNKNYNNPLLCNKAGALFTTDRILVTNSSSDLITNNLPFEPQVAWNDSFFIQGDKWYNVSGIFVADKPYKYLTIGNFETNSGTSTQNTGNVALGQFSIQSTSYINIDDVVVAEVPGVLDDSCKAAVTGIHPVEPPAKSSFIIYPNPAHSTINWNSSQFENTEVNVEVYSLTGQIIYKAKAMSTSLSIENYLPGIYFIRINDGGHFYSAKFVKE